jgi:hypothetical protein
MTSILLAGYASRRAMISNDCRNFTMLFSGATPRHCVPG